jgi:hypothetical protein
MRSYIATRNVSAVVSGIVLIGLALSGAAYAITDAVFQYSAPKTGYLTIHASAFTPEDSSSVYNNETGIDSIGDACFAAPVNLPHGAKVTQLALWYARHDVGPPASFWLRRLSLGDDSVSNVASVPTPSTNGEYKMAAVTITLADPSIQTVNNARYAYFLELCISDQENVRSGRIKYTYKSAGD